MSSKVTMNRKAIRDMMNESRDYGRQNKNSIRAQARKARTVKVVKDDVRQDA